MWEKKYAMQCTLNPKAIQTLRAVYIIISITLTQLPSERLGEKRT